MNEKLNVDKMNACYVCSRTWRGKLTQYLINTCQLVHSKVVFDIFEDRHPSIRFNLIQIIALLSVCVPCAHLSLLR